MDRILVWCNREYKKCTYCTLLCILPKAGYAILCRLNLDCLCTIALSAGDREFNEISSRPSRDYNIGIGSCFTSPACFVKVRFDGRHGLLAKPPRLQTCTFRYIRYWFILH